MRRFCLIVAFVSLMGSMHAQEEVKHHEIIGAVGLFNDVQFISGLSDFIGTVFTLGYVVQPGKYSAFTPNIGYRYWFNKRIGLGVSYAMDFNSVKIRKTTDSVTFFEERQRYFSTITAEFACNYMVKPICQLYGMVGMGATIANIPKSEIKQWIFFNMQLTPIGVRVGRDVAGFIEFGWGYKGLINAGLSVKF